MSLGSGLSIYDQPVMKCDYANLAICCICRRFSYQFCYRRHGVGATLIRLFSDIICLIVLGVGLHVFCEEQNWSCLCYFSESRPT